MKKGLFITLEGNDGAGKTTAARALCQALIKEGCQVVLTREPGGCPISEQIRQVLLSSENKEMDYKTEALLYAAARRQHVVQTIQPALERGDLVLCDRFLDSSLAYQGAARGLGIEEVESLNKVWALEEVQPDLTLFFSVPLETGMNRIQLRGDANRLDQEHLSFHLNVRKGFDQVLEYHKQKKHPVVVIDASQNPDQVFKQAYEAVKEKMKDYE